MATTRTQRILSRILIQAGRIMPTVAAVLCCTTGYGASQSASNDLPRNISHYLAEICRLDRKAASITVTTATGALEAQAASHDLAQAKQSVHSDDQSRVLVSIRVVHQTQAVLAHLQALPVAVHMVNGEHRMIEAWVRVSDVPTVARLTGVLSVAPSFRPIMHAGIAMTQGDTLLHSDDVRNIGHTGSPFLIGVLSDSALDLSGSQVSNDLPPVVDRYLEFPASDEGRAMLEIIHDVAPGARLAHHSGALSKLSFAAGIRTLAAAGCRVLVDDLGYYDEPFFQDGILAQTVDRVANSNGVVYVSAAGNEGDLSYESHYVDENSADTNANFHDFDPGPGTDTFQRISVAPVPPGYQSVTRLVLQWDDPFATTNGVVHDFDVYLYNSASNVLARSEGDNLALQEPMEILTWTRANASPTNVTVAIKRRAGDASSALKYVLYNAVSIDEWHTHSGTIYGQAAGTTAVAVGAVPYFAPTNVEPYSSRGQVTILFDTRGNRLPAPEYRQKPDVVAPDKVNTTFFGEDIPEDTDTLPNFPGTSAAAPHVAAVASLLLSANPHLTAAQLREALTSSALDLGIPGPDPLFGFGLVDADAARLRATAMPDTTPPTVHLLSPIPTNGWAVKQASLLFSEPLDLAAATNVNNYSLLQAGEDGLFGTGDDVTYNLAVDYDTNSLSTSLSPTFPATTLTNGQYRLMLNGTGGLADPAGNPLCGGSNRVFLFTVAARSSIVDVEGNHVLADLRRDGTLFAAYTSDYASWYFRSMVGRFDAGGGSAGPFRAAASGIAAFTVTATDIAATDAGGLAVFAVEAVIVQGGDIWGLKSQTLDQDARPTRNLRSERFIAYGSSPRVAKNSSGAFAVAFDLLDGSTGSDTHIQGKLFNPDGSSNGPSFRVSEEIGAGSPVVGIASNGTSVFAWRTGCIRARRFDSAGQPLGGEFHASSATTGETAPDIAVAEDGSFVVVWQRTATGILMRRFDATGIPLGDEVGVFPSGSGCQVSLAPDGRFVIVWLSPDGDGNGVFAQRYTATGTPSGERLWVSSGVAGDQTDARVCVATNGDFTVLWQTGAKAQARWVSAVAPDEYLAFDGPRVRSQTPTSPLLSPFDHFTVSFNRPVNATTFATNDVQLRDPVGRVVPVASLSSLDHVTFDVNVSEQRLPGAYRFTIGPGIQDASGRSMNQNGNATNGEPSDVFTSQFALVGSVATIPYTQGFESNSIDALPGWSFNRTGKGILSITPEHPEGTTTNCLKLDSVAMGAEAAILSLNLAGATNVTLDFSYVLSYLSTGAVEVSRDGTNWYRVWDLTGWPYTWQHVSLDLDREVRRVGIAYDAAFHIKFRQDHTPNVYTASSVFRLDNVRVASGIDVFGPRIVVQSPAGSVLPPVTNVLLTFNEAINPTTFATSDVGVVSPVGTPVALNPVTPIVDTGDHKSFVLLFAAPLNLSGTYDVRIGPDVLDLAGNRMDQAGTGVEGNAYHGSLGITQAAVAASLPFMEDFECGTVTSLRPFWSFARTGAGIVTISTGNPLITGPSCLALDSVTRGSETATLTINLAGATNVVLDLWYMVTLYTGASVRISRNGVNWSEARYLSFGELGYGTWQHVSIDLDAEVRRAGMVYDSDFHIRFYHTDGSSSYTEGAKCWLDGIRIGTADGHMSIGRHPRNDYTIQFSPHPDRNYTVQYRDDLCVDPEWQALPGAPHNDGFLFISNTVPRRFYRMLISPNSP